MTLIALMVMTGLGVWKMSVKEVPKVEAAEKETTCYSGSEQHTFSDAHEESDDIIPLCGPPVDWIAVTVSNPSGVAVCGIEQNESRYCTPFTHVEPEQRAMFYVEIEGCGLLGLFCSVPRLSSSSGQMKLTGNFVKAIVDVEDEPATASPTAQRPNSAGVGTIPLRITSTVHQYEGIL